MHTALLAGAYLTLACSLCVWAVVSFVAMVWGQRKVEYLLLGLMSLVIGVQSTSTGIAWLDGLSQGPAHWATMRYIAMAASLIAAAIHLHLALRYQRVKHLSIWAVVAYFFAGLLALTVLLKGGLIEDQAQTSRLWLLGLDISQTWAPHTWVLILYGLMVSVLHLGACFSFGRAYWRGRTEALAMFVGAGVFMLAAINDVFADMNLIRGLSFQAIALTLFNGVAASAFFRRFGQLRKDCSRQTRKYDGKKKEVQQLRSVMRELKSELGRKEQLAAIGEMAAVIAHEVRNPVTIISNAGASLRREGLAAQDRDTLLSILDEETARLAHLVTDLLDYARPVNVQRERVVLHDLCQRATLLTKHHDAKVTYDESSVRGQIWGDANLLRQVFDNLVENAVQATEGMGTVTVEVTQQTRDAKEGFAVQVTDDGEGMNTQVRNRAKDAFFTTRPKGTGLGLAIVNRIVEAHGGEMTFESRAGEGTRVTVFLPIGTESLPPPETSRRLMDTLPPLSHSDERPIYPHLKD